MGVRLAETYVIKLNARSWPRLCQNSRDRFLPVNFSHVDAISRDLSAPIRVLAILRGGRNEFLHRLGREESVRP
jgi:hypothetical protein